MISSFPTSKLMVGSVIPGFRQQLAPSRIVTYPDHTDDPLLLKRERPINPLVQYPKMNQDHSEGHSFLEKLKALMAGGPEYTQNQIVYRPRRAV